MSLIVTRASASLAVQIVQDNLTRPSSNRSALFETWSVKKCSLDQSAFVA